MRINPRIEHIVREALANVVRKRPELVERSFQEITKLKEADRLEAVRLAGGILWVALYRMRNEVPTAADLDAAAAAIVTAAHWAKLNHADVVSILDAVVKGTEVSEVMHREKAATLLFVACGQLTSLCAPKERLWEDYLDECEAALEATSE